MSFLPSFKSTFSSLADTRKPQADDSRASSTPPSRYPQTDSTLFKAPSVPIPAPKPSAPRRPTVPPLPLELLADVAPAFGFESRPRKRVEIAPLPLEMLSDDAAAGGAPPAWEKRSPPASAAVHAGAYKRPRSTPRASVSGSYVRCERRGNSTSSVERSHARSTVSLTCVQTYSSRKREANEMTYRGGSPRRCAQLVTFVTPSLSHRSAGSRLGGALGLLVDDEGIVDEYRGVDVLNSPMKRSLYSGGTPRLRGGLTFSGGPTESDMSFLRGRGRGFVDGTEEEEEEQGVGSEEDLEGNEPWRQHPRPRREEEDEDGGVEKGRGELESVQCPHCPKKLLNQVTLQNHVKVVHDHSGSFECTQCGLRFMWRSTLRNHVRLVHEKQRPYACEECGKAFRWKSHLREHFSVVHKGEKPFKCGTCGKAFGRKNNMQKHMKKHAEGGGG